MSPIGGPCGVGALQYSLADADNSLHNLADRIWDLGFEKRNTLFVCPSQTSFREGAWSRSGLLLTRIIHGWVEHGSPCTMVRCANRPETGCRVAEGLTPCVTHRFLRRFAPRTLQFVNNPG